MNKGFTLIETIVYIALLAMIMGGALFATFNIIEGAGHLDKNATIQEEGSFILRKLDWALGSVKTINTPASGATGSTLRVTKYEGATTMTIDMCLQNRTLWMRENHSVGGSCDTLGGYASTTTSNVNVSSVLFKHLTNPAEGVEADVVINGVTFSTTRYVRQ